VPHVEQELLTLIYPSAPPVFSGFGVIILGAIKLKNTNNVKNVRKLRIRTINITFDQAS
jgi:hypothetical protein